jgi:hypothetical protein
MDTCLFHYHSEPYAEHSSSSNQTAHGEVYAGRSFEARLPIHHSGHSIEIRHEYAVGIITHWHTKGRLGCNATLLSPDYVRWIESLM